ncbi:MAG: ABC transporter substrate-binding protein [Acidimicrobiales bacterium]
MDEEIQSAEQATIPEPAGTGLGAKIDRRQFLNRAAALGVSAGAAGAFLAVPGSLPTLSRTAPSSARSQHGGTLRFGPFPDGADYDPATNDFDFPNPPFPSIYEGLMAYNPLKSTHSPAENLLAESIEVSTDGRRYRFKVREGVEFHHDYGEMTAADVKYSFERNAGLTKLYPGAPKSAVSYYTGDFSSLESVTVTGKYTGVVVFKEPFVPFETMTLPWTTSGYIFPHKAVEKYGSTFGHHPTGTGPYEVVSYTPASEMVLQRFSRYSGANHRLGARNFYDEIQIKMTALNALPKGEALTVALQSGEVDFTYNLGALDVQRLKNNSGFRTYSPAAPLDYYFLGMDVRNHKLSDLRVREAIRYALDIPEIIKANRLPLSTRMPSLISKSLGVGYWKSAPEYHRDVSKAKSLLKDAGVKNLSLDIANPLITETPGEPIDLMTVIQSNLKDVGIDLNIIETPPNSYVTKPGYGTLITSYYGGAPDPYYQFEWFTCSQIGVWNYASWCNKQYSDLFVSLGRTANKKQRDSIAIEMQKLIDRDASYVWLCSAINFAASSSDTRIVWDRNGNPLLHYAHRI